MNKKHFAGAAAILVLLAGVGWAMGFFSGDSELAEVEKMRDDLLQKVDTMSADQRRAEFGALRERARDFSPEQRQHFGQGMRQFMMQRVDRLLDMPPEEQNLELDKWIDRMEGFRTDREARGGGDRGADRSSAERDQRRKERLDRSTPAMRAKMARMRNLINNRRGQRGLPSVEGGGGMFGGRGR